MVNDIVICGQGGITATVLKYSICNGKKIITYELEYPRMIHAELLTHALLARNSASSRAVPLKDAASLVSKNPARPIHWGMNQRGMQAREELTGKDLISAKRLWNKGIEASVELAIEFDKIKAHKQYGARGLEPYQMMKTVLSGTEFANFYHLRDDAAAQPEFQELAACMRRGMEIIQPQELYHSEYHLPYINTTRNDDGILVYSTSDGTILSQQDAIKVSASCCAQVSYRKLDESLEKTIDVYNKLLGMGKKHASPFEHQATPMKAYENPFDVSQWEDGITHVSKNGSLWSGRFIGWIQERQLIPHTTVW